jgi:hypothetical protein
MSTSRLPDLAATVESGRDFISASLGRDGSWRDFDTLAGESTEWVSGFVLAAVDCLAGYDPVWTKARECLIFSVRPSGGWGYNASIPADCDSTAWAVRALRGGRWVPPAVVRHAVAFIGWHQDPESGGFRTFQREREIADVIGAATPEAVEAWCSPHVCVTANVLLALLDLGVSPKSTVVDRGLRFLLDRREEDGTWSSYWWSGATYSTYHATLALTWAGQMGTEELEVMGNAIAGLQAADGSWSDGHDQGNAFATSFALLSLLLVPSRSSLDDPIGRAISWLNHHQLDDGSWPTAPILRIPPGTVTDPSVLDNWQLRARGTGSMVEDHGRLFSTAAATMALHRCRRLKIEADLRDRR